MSKWVLDASALLALLNAEPGHEQVTQALAEGASISAVNLSETVAKLSDAGMPEEDLRKAIGPLPLSVVDFDAALAYRAGILRPSTREKGLSLGDRACLALAARLGLPALTADQAWRDVPVGVDIRLVR